MSHPSQQAQVQSQTQTQTQAPSQAQAQAQESEPVLTNEQQAILNEEKVNMRAENEKYLREHPELKTMMNEFFVRVLTERPDDIRGFAAQHFSEVQSKKKVT